MLNRPWRGLFAGIGGGGIVTSGAILAMAAHIEGRHVRTLDFTGLAQKNGAVVAHVQIADHAADLDVVRIPLGTADLMVAADLAVAAGAGVLERNATRASVVGNLDLVATAAFKHDALLPIDARLHRRTIERVTDAGASTYLHAARLAEKLFGNAQAMNTLLLGLAWQNGLVPASQAAILRAIELNGASVAVNRRAFLWGRILAAMPALVDGILGDAGERRSLTVNETIEVRATALIAYQSRAYADRYLLEINAIAEREAAVFGQPGRLSRAAAEGLYRVMAYKDEYEVARLHANASYGKGAVFHLSPPLLGRVDPATGRRGKIAVPGWLAKPVFRMLRAGRQLRGTPFDPFALQGERRRERTLIDTYLADLHAIVERLSPETMDVALQLADLPDMIRGFGPVKEANRNKALARRDNLLKTLRGSAFVTTSG